MAWPAGGHGRAPALLAAVLSAFAFALIWPARPYYLPYYNPLVGGTKVAPRVLLYGWGEALDRAAAYLNTSPTLNRYMWRHT